MQEPVQIVRSNADLRALLPQLLAARGIPIGLDTETSGPTIVWRGKKRPDPYRARLTGFSFSLRDANWYVPVAHKLDAEGLPATNVTADAAREFIQALLDAVETHELTVVCHNLKYDLQVFKNFGVRIPVFSDKLYCSQVAAWLAGWGSDHKSLALKKLAVRLGLGEGDTFDEVAKGRQAEDISVNEIAPYAGRDAWLAAAVLKRAWERLEQLDLTWHYREIDMPQIEILRGAEEAGNAVNAELLRVLEQKLTTEADALKAEFYAKTEWIVDMPVKRRVPTGELFKNGKPKLKTIEVPEPTLLGADVSNDGQVSRWMYEELELWPRKGLEKNGANHYPVDKETIEKFCALPGAAGELARIRLEYGLRSKLISTYIAPLLGLPPQYGDGRLHTSYNVTGTVTQRLSSSGPNLQNLPSRTKEGKLIREALIADAGWKIIVFDYSQIELRICAHISQDEEMIACYVLGEDVHQGTLDGMRREWPGAQRTDAKVTNFSTIYRISAPSLAVKMRTSEDKAEASIEAFYNRFQRVAVYHRQAIAYAAKHGHARTIDGFKRQLDTTPKFNRRSRKMEMSWAVQNEAINTPIQGSAGGLIKIAMRDCHRVWVAKGVYGKKVRFVGQEHDSAIATAVDDFVAEASADLEHAMVNAWKLRVPLAAEGGSGNSWAEAKG